MTGTDGIDEARLPRRDGRGRPPNPGIEGEERDGWFFWRGSWRQS